MNQVPASGVPDGSYLLDVREDDEWAAGHAPGAVHIPLGRLGDQAGQVPRDRPVYVICRSGGRSARATQALVAGGCDVTNVSDGMQGWEAAGRAMVSDSGVSPFVA
jgi:rhodanese-related sulfurtransferase